MLLQGGTFHLIPGGLIWLPSPSFISVFVKSPAKNHCPVYILWPVLGTTNPYGGIVNVFEIKFFLLYSDQ